MTLFKYFNENGKLLHTKDEPLNADNFARYVEEHGEEKAALYIEALFDILKELDQEVMYNFKNGNAYRKSDFIRSKALEKFFEQKEALFASDAAKPVLDRVEEKEFCLPSGHKLT